MTTKTAFVSSIAAFMGVLLLGVAVIALFVDTNAPNADALARQLGLVLGFVCAIPVGIIWLLRVVQIRQERESNTKSRSRSRQ